MGELFGARFTSDWGAYDQTGAWWAELKLLAPAQLAIGLRRVRQRVQDAARQGDTAWPPMPAEFAALCQPRPEDMGLPTEAEAWREATANAHQPGQHPWSHEAVRMAGAAVGWWELTHGGGESRASRQESRFRKEYGALVNRVLAGEQLQARHLVGHDSQLSRGERAERASREAAQRQAAAAGMPERMNSEQGLRMMRAALGSR
ncbi:replication protein P [Vreelandella aquamarina]|uniref:replication protein P n=1 Tax=Vreelandella aquamarina TaxID=77097 RepID=UPI001CC35A0A|nr:replication protein P [Halomonas aquamarina]